MISAPASYPAHQSVDVALRDGSTVHVRPALPDDRGAIETFLRSLSPDSLYFRGCGTVNVEWLSDWSVDLDYGDRYGLVVTSGTDQQVVAHAAYVRLDEHRAEVAFEVADSFHGYGIGTLLLGQLAAVAAAHGIETLVATVMASNWKMLHVFQDSGFPVTQRVDAGDIEVSLPTVISERVLKSYEGRAHEASVSAVRGFLKPASVAVVGASRNPASIGGALIENLQHGGFKGRVYPVNPRAREIDGARAYGSVLELPEPVDLAVVAVPAAGVVAVARECAQLGVRALLVISSGFAEVGEQGARRQRELYEVCRQAGMRLVGPNCLGVLNTDPAIGLNATFSRRIPPAGRVALMSQSGGVAIALMEVAARLRIGISSFVAVGNKSDISGNDLLEYWEDDANVGLIALYLESFGNPRRFARVARRVSASKPILAVKSGRTAAGSRAASSHTAALLSASDVTVDALFRQAGVIRADTLGELLDTAALLGTQPLPRGARVAIVTNGGGPAIMCADDCQAAGLDIVELPQSLQEQLSRVAPDNAAVGNPVDLTAAAQPRDYRKVVETLIAADACDAIITLFVPALGISAEAVARAIDTAADEIPIAAVFMGARLEEQEGPRAPVAAARFELPEDAVRALVHATEYARWLRRPQGVVVEPAQCRPDKARQIIGAAAAGGSGWMSPDDVTGLLDCYGIPCVRTEFALTADEAVTVACGMVGPVALKATAPGLVHKSDVGGVALGLDGDAAVRAAAATVERAVAAAGYTLEGLIVQEMAPSGVELLVGVVHDPSFGPVVACGAGGTTAEVLGDVAVRITPLTDLDASEMLRSLRTFPLLDGYRGRPRTDVAAVEDVLHRVSAMVQRHPEIAELDLNPLIASSDRVCVTDARVRLAPPTPDPPLGALRAR